MTVQVSRVSWRIGLAALVLACVPVAGAAQSTPDQSCATFEIPECLSSTQCMLVSGSAGGPYLCVPPWDRCQIDYQQLRGWSWEDKPAARCELRKGCAFVQPGPCYCPPDVACFCGGGPPPDCQMASVAPASPPAGAFQVIDVRTVSGVAAPFTPETSPIGLHLSFAGPTITMEGVSCKTWSLREIDVPVDTADPMLADALMGPLPSDPSDGDRRLLRGWRYDCEGEVFAQVLQADPIALVIPWRNSSVYLIAEAVLPASTVFKIQDALRSVKFLDKASTGEFDSQTRAAVSRWSTYRLSETSTQDVYDFFASPVTENLFDRMGVFSFP